MRAPWHSENREHACRCQRILTFQLLPELLQSGPLDDSLSSTIATQTAADPLPGFPLLRLNYFIGYRRGKLKFQPAGYVQVSPKTPDFLTF